MQTTITESAECDPNAHAEEALKKAADEAARIAGNKPPAAPEKPRRSAEAIAHALADLKKKEEDNPLSLAADVAALYRKSGYMSIQQSEITRRREQRDKDEARQKRVAALREGSGVFKIFEDADLDDVEFVRRVMPEALPRYCMARDELATLVDRPGIMVACGKSGPGKSHLTSALVNRFCAQCRPARYIRAGDFFLELQSTFGQPGRTKLDLVRRFERYELLVVDEFDVRSTSRESKWEEQILRQLIDARYANLVSTVLVTNLDPDEILGRLPTAVRDRIRESGAVILFDWGSLRRFGRE